ncbi:MAG: hypothetical protein JO328_02770 [Hyphomicrobiales bacterium]|nr:hypothetical protein [Hyphomicrobiales bacterium]MBV8825972.1 hypothetical protein [Hyphomicrobiales bacterium]MBV9428541.1 hypothetical protein [Bradyrhizobiaceae bacterium]
MTVSFSLSRPENKNEALTNRLSGILRQILIARNDLAADRDVASSTFAALGLTSVDYLEFILNVEADLNIDIPDEAMLNPALSSVDTWAAWLADNAASLQTPGIGAA